MQPVVRMLGCHGIPASHGGFESAAQAIGLHLVAKGWRVVVYCQVAGRGRITRDIWRGIERVLIPVAQPGWRGTVMFDWLSIRHACRYRDPCLTFGYNTAPFNAMQWIHRIPNVINMDGLEWARRGWSLPMRWVLRINERIAAALGDALIADHPVIRQHLLSVAPPQKISTIAYGADAMAAPPSVAPVQALGLTPGGYFTLIARPVAENSVLEIVRAFSARRRGRQLLVLGDYRPGVAYHRAVQAIASAEVVFAGAIYEPERVQALRHHACGYLHGHTVGGTNPSLVEALAAGNPVIAHDNRFNRWVAGEAAVYFDDEIAIDRALAALLAQPERAAAMAAAARARFAGAFCWERVAGQYEALLWRFQHAAAPETRGEEMRGEPVAAPLLELAG